MREPLFLIGFMAAGKTSVGRALAQAHGRRFVDLDDVIAEAGEPTAQLVARDEAEFRRREAGALARVIAEGSDGPVVATGGGAAAYGDNLERMRGAGLVVALAVDPDEAVRRAVGGPTRPLLGSTVDASALAARRAPSYRHAHAVVETTGRSAADVVAHVEHVERVWCGLPARFRGATILALGERSYPVVVDDGVVDGALVRASIGEVSRVALVADRDVLRSWEAPVISELSAAGFAFDPIEVEPGEPSKSFDMYRHLCERLIAHRMDRGSAIVALGGGVIGDLAGFVAATLFRGIPIVQLPTTIVAMTDAAIGGKTAIDLPAGKNLVGAFHQPRLVSCGLATLATLPPRERRAGFGELWKYALLDGPDLWRAVDACAEWARDGGAHPPALRTVIDRSIAYKAAIVGRDERELTGHRALLNLGHTIGHAIEAASFETKLPLLHGEAVGLGLVAACRVSAALGHPDLSQEVTAALRRTGLPAELEPWLTQPVLDRIGVDKKRIGNHLRFVVIREVGSCETAEIAVTEVSRILRSAPTA
jgi:shikimate kinase / 3-dehydroquinate synthase